MIYSALDPEADRAAVVLTPARRPADRLREVDAKIKALIAERAALRRELHRHPREWARFCLQAACEVYYATATELTQQNRHLRVALARHTWIGLLAMVTGCNDASVAVLVGRDRAAVRHSREQCLRLLETNPDFRRRWRAACELVGIQP